MKVWVIYLLAHSIVLLSFSFSNKINDNFCDFDEGNDENLTSACSYKAVSFLCINGPINYTIPSSRVSDGVCDCCDGSDEIGNPFKTICEDNCIQELNILKKNALDYHRNVQAGLRAKTERIEQIRTRKRNDQQNLDSLKTERDRIKNMLLTMKVLLYKENSRENELRFKLVRERENRCAAGYENACNYFYSGYFNEDELKHEGFPEIYAKKKTRNQHKHSEKELEYLRKLKGIERVRLSLCEYPDLLPDDDARIFTRVGEYVTFAKSKGGEISRQKLAYRLRKQTLFASILEDGERGRLLGILWVLEIIGLLISPIIYPIWYFSSFMSDIWDKSWVKLRQCAQSESSFSSICYLLIQFDEADSTATKILNIFDYTRYSGAMAIIDRVRSQLDSPIWAWEVITRAPLLYWGYYIEGRKNEMPPRRQSCLLRSGIKSAEREIMEIDLKIQEQIDINELLEGNKGNKNSLDYGLDGSFEILKDVCLKKEKDEIIYEICFMKEIKQDDKFSLGFFTHWGFIDQITSNVMISNTGLAVLSNKNLINSNHNPNNNVELTRGASIFNQLRNQLVFNTSQNVEKYSEQWYEEGTICLGSINKPRRSRVVLKCGHQDEILSVIEIEVCFYHFDVITPAACGKSEEKKSLLYLEKLGVFGFSRDKRKPSKD